MSEDTLLNSEPSNETNETEQPSFLWAEGVAGQGDVPEWYKADKYKSVSDQAKAYGDLEKRFGGFTGAPEAYELGEDVDPEDTFVQMLSEIGTSSNMNQETFAKVYELGEKLLEANAGINKEREMAALGDKAEERIQNVDAFLKNNLGADYERLMAGVNSAATVELVEKLIAQTGQAKLPTGNAVPVNVPTQADIDEMMNKTDENGRQLYHTSESYRNKVRQAMAQMHGKSEFSYVG
jgi:hypothetical protein